MRGEDAGALCLSSSNSLIRRDIIKPRQHHAATRTSTRPPPFPTSAPCPYRTERRTFPIMIVNVHQLGDNRFALLPILIGNIHQKVGTSQPSHSWRNQAGTGQRYA